MNILVLYPSGRELPDVRDEIEKHTRDDVDITLDNTSEALPAGSISYEYEYSKSANAVTEYIIDAEKEGFDGVVVGCQGEPGVDEARSVVDIPVLGTLQPSCQMARQMGKQFSVIGESLKTQITETKRIKDLGFRDQLASYRPVNLTTEDFASESPDHLREKVEEVVKTCVEEDGAEVIVSGCTLLLEALQDDVTLSTDELGITTADGQSVDIPIVLPTIVGLKTCAMMVDLQQSLGYPAAVSRVGHYRKAPDGQSEAWRSWLAENDTPEEAYTRDTVSPSD
jgi:allantoin racemase